LIAPEMHHSAWGFEHSVKHATWGGVGCSFLAVHTSLTATSEHWDMVLNIGCTCVNWGLAAG